MLILIVVAMRFVTAFIKPILCYVMLCYRSVMGGKNIEMFGSITESYKYHNKNNNNNNYNNSCRNS